jgi:hypothetical protein
MVFMFLMIGMPSIGRVPSYIYGGEVLPRKESFKPSKLSLTPKSDSIFRLTDLTGWGYRSDWVYPITLASSILVIKKETYHDFQSLNVNHLQHGTTVLKP